MLPITFLFNEGARVRVCFVLCALTFLSVGLSTLYLIVIRVLLVASSSYTSLVEGYNGDYLMSVLTYLAAFTILFNIIACYMGYVSMYPERRNAMQVKMLMMTLAQLCLVAAFIWCSILCYIYADHVEDSFKGGLSTSMRRYRDNIEVKENMDHLQANYECCGDNKYTDWFRISWVADEFVDTSDPDIRDRVRSGSGYQSDDVPFSCCDRAARRPCITQFIHDNKKHFNYDYQKGLTVHVDGCREALMSYVRMWLFLGMCIVTSICLVIQAIVLILLRYLQTSIALAIKKGDPTADSLAYILSICLPTDDMTEDKCQRPPTSAAASAAPTAAPSFASGPPPTMQTLEQAAATLGAVGQPELMTTVSVPQSPPPDAGVDGMNALVCRRVPIAAATPINNSARTTEHLNQQLRHPASAAPSNRSSVISM